MPESAGDRGGPTSRPAGEDAGEGAEKRRGHRRRLGTAPIPGDTAGWKRRKHGCEDPPLAGGIASGHGGCPPESDARGGRGNGKVEGEGESRREGGQQAERGGCAGQGGEDPPSERQLKNPFSPGQAVFSCRGESGASGHPFLWGSGGSPSWVGGCRWGDARGILRNSTKIFPAPAISAVPASRPVPGESFLRAPPHGLVSSAGSGTDAPLAGRPRNRPTPPPAAAGRSGWAAAGVRSGCLRR